MRNKDTNNKRRNVLARINRWMDHASLWGIPVTRILIHPDDAPFAPKRYLGLPVVTLPVGGVELQGELANEDA